MGAARSSRAGNIGPARTSALDVAKEANEMPLFINTNVTAISSRRNPGVTNSKLRKALERLSSGMRSAADDAAGLAISERTRVQLGAARNQMEPAENSLGVSVENLSACESRIRDADIAAVSSELVTRRIMQQSGGGTTVGTIAGALEGAGVYLDTRPRARDRS